MNHLQVPDDRFWQAVMDHFSAEQLDGLDLSLPRVEAWERVTKSMRNVVEDYRPEGQISKLDIFCVQPLPRWGFIYQRWLDEVLGKWNEYCATPVVFHHVDGHHFSVLRPEHIECFQQALNKALAARGV